MMNDFCRVFIIPILSDAGELTRHRKIKIRKISQVNDNFNVASESCYNLKVNGMRKPMITRQEYEILQPSII